MTLVQRCCVTSGSVQSKQGRLVVMKNFITVSFGGATADYIGCQASNGVTDIIPPFSTCAEMGVLFIYSLLCVTSECPLPSQTVGAAGWGAY